MWTVLISLACGIGGPSRLRTKRCKFHNALKTGSLHSPDTSRSPLQHHLITQISPLYFGNSFMTPPSLPIRPYPTLLYA